MERVFVPEIEDEEFVDRREGVDGEHAHGSVELIEGEEGVMTAKYGNTATGCCRDRVRDV
jgi:hypothetical protein